MSGARLIVLPFNGEVDIDYCSKVFSLESTDEHLTGQQNRKKSEQTIKIPIIS
jgi:hypothetical protein